MVSYKIAVLMILSLFSRDLCLHLKDMKLGYAIGTSNTTRGYASNSTFGYARPNPNVYASNTSTTSTTSGYTSKRTNGYASNTPSGNTINTTARYARNTTSEFTRNNSSEYTSNSLNGHTSNTSNTSLYFTNTTSGNASNITSRYARNTNTEYINMTTSVYEDISDTNIQTESVVTSTSVPKYAYWTDVANKYHLIFATINIPLGTISNILSFSIYVRKAHRDHSLSVYLSALAVTDTIILWWQGSYDWMVMAFGVILPIPNSYCNIRGWIVLASATYAAFLVVATAIERCIAVFFPLKASSWLTVRRARIVVVSLAAGCLLLYVPFTFLATLTYKCFPVGYAGIIYSAVYFVKALVFLQIIPNFVLFFTSLAIIWKITFGRKILEESKSSQGNRSTEARKVTRTVLLVSFCYLCFTLPYVVWANYRAFVYKHDWYAGKHADKPTKFINSFLVNLGNLNNSINFWLYIISSSKFRKELVIMLRLQRFFKQSPLQEDTSSTGVASGSTMSLKTTGMQAEELRNVI